VTLFFIADCSRWTH